MKEQIDRSIRRHHIERLKKARKNYWGRDLTSDDKALGKLVHTATLCSCQMCCNIPLS